MRRGEVWRINFDPTVGAEIRKTRPVIIVNDDEVGIFPCNHDLGQTTPCEKKL